MDIKIVSCLQVRDVKRYLLKLVIDDILIPAFKYEETIRTDSRRIVSLVTSILTSSSQGSVFIFPDHHLHFSPTSPPYIPHTSFSITILLTVTHYLEWLLSLLFVLCRTIPLFINTWIIFSLSDTLHYLCRI